MVVVLEECMQQTDREWTISKRMKRFELSTLSLARRCSTTELHPQKRSLDHCPFSMDYREAIGQAQRQRRKATPPIYHTETMPTELHFLLKSEENEFS